MTLRELIYQSIEVQQHLLEDEYIHATERIGEALISSLRKGHTILIAGNGGSAADAQHFAAELAGRFLVERRGLPVIALTTNSSILTAIGNDFSYDQVFARQIEAYGRPGDIFIGITTSGNSKNILKALTVAKKNRLICVGLLGNEGGLAKPLCDFALVVPSANTQYIQEAHIVVIHALSYLIDQAWKSFESLSSV
ncbi:MAG: D-sedoheptulose 7-phosphate isomerase [bacterium]|nr:D-sedoheptulose 7-phosphate isomerase [bacterium]